MKARGVQARINEADAEALCLALLDKFPALIWRSGVDAKCDYFNQAWVDFTGRSMQEQVGDGWTKGVHPEDRAECIQCYLKAFHSRRPFAMEYRLRRHDGVYRWILDQGRAFTNREGRFAGYIGSCIDVTERRETERALEKSREQLRALSLRLQSVREEESKRMAREIHDALGQALSTLNMDLMWMKQRLEAEKNPLLRLEFKRRLGKTAALLEATAGTVQRIATELRPAMLDDLGLTSTLEWHAGEFEARTGIPCRWKPKAATPQLHRDQSTALFRIFQEILTNIGRHARARSVRLKLIQHHGLVILEAVDDGRGFNQSELKDHKSLGLLGMRERAGFIGGRVQIDSAPGKGTKVTVTIPLSKTNRAGKLKPDAFHGKNKTNSHRR